VRFLRGFLRRAVTCALAAAVGAGTTPAFAQSAPPAAPQQVDPQQVRQELDRLRQEFEAIRDSYGARLAALEAKLVTTTPAAPLAEALAPVTPPPAVTTPPEPPVLAPSQTPSSNPAMLSKVFNPDMAVIGNFLGAAGQNRVNPSPSLQMNEAEATFQAVVDPYARGDFFLSFTPEGVEIEEGFITLTSLPGGLLAKVGKMKEQFGKVNTLHPHALSWADRPLAMTNLLGGDEGIADSGVSVSKLLLNPFIFLEATGELFEGTAGPFQSHGRSDVSWVGRLRGYRDLTEGTNLDIGTSVAYGHNDAGPDSRTRLFGVDATFRYRPLQRAIYRRFLARTELFWSHREQPPGVGGDQSAFGYYVSGDYQFSRRWFTGLRYDSSGRATDARAKDEGASAILTFWPSEFSQVRGQFRRTKYADGTTVNELLFQLLFSIGAHGAHVF
jgi:hypothetical protein